MQPIVTGDSIDLSLVVVLGCVLVGVVAVVVAAVVLRFLLAAATEAGEIGRDVGGWIAVVVLRQRRHLATTAWFCSRCRSENAAAASECYRGCGPRPAVEAQLGGETPTSPSGGGRHHRR